MANCTCIYSVACNPLGYSKCPSRMAPVRRNRATTSSCVGTRCIAVFIVARHEEKRNPDESCQAVKAVHPEGSMLGDSPIRHFRKCKSVVRGPQESEIVDLLTPLGTQLSQFVIAVTAVRLAAGESCVRDIVA